MGLFDFLSSATPAGAAATVGERIVGTVLGGVDKLIRDFKLPPEELAKWEQYKLQVQLDSKKIDAEDRNSARQREMAVRDSTPRTLAFMIVGAFIAVATFMVIHPYVWPDKELSVNTIGMIGTVVGYLSAKAEQVASYYFGSSAGSASKSDTIDHLVGK